MKILHCVESYYPALGGMQEVVKQLSERLADMGHDVTVATKKHPERSANVINNVKIVAFDIGGNMVKGITGDKDAYERFLLESDFDIVCFFAAQQWATDVALPILDQIRGKKVSVPTGYSGFYWPEFKPYFEKMKSWIRSYDMNVFLSNDYRDINFARENGVTRYCIIPNGAAEDEFLPEPAINVRHELGLTEDTFLLLHVGSYTGWKGQHEAMEIFLRSGIRKGALLMIGNNSENFGISKKKMPGLYIRKMINDLIGNKKIFFRHFPRDFTVAAYKQADLFLFPSNIECSPIVLFECAAAKLPFVSTDVGNASEIARWTNGGIILPTKKDNEGFSYALIKKSAKIVNQLYRDKAKRRVMAEKAYAEWQNKFSWQKIAENYEEMYASLTIQDDRS